MDYKDIFTNQAATYELLVSREDYQRNLVSTINRLLGSAFIAVTAECASCWPMRIPHKAGVVYRTLALAHHEELVAVVRRVRVPDVDLALNAGYQLLCLLFALVALAKVPHIFLERRVVVVPP